MQFDRLSEKEERKGKQQHFRLFLWFKQEWKKYH